MRGRGGQGAYGPTLMAPRAQGQVVTSKMSATVTAGGAPEEETKG